MWCSIARRQRALTLVLTLACASLLLSRPFRHPGTVQAAGLPTFGLGLSAQPDSTGIYGWMPTSGVPWSYAYQYLSGGVNTGSGWETWNSSGQYALYYAQGAASHSYIPVFSYYELNQSTGSCSGCGEAQKDLSNLNNAATMSSYFQNFTLLLQRLGAGRSGGISGFGQTAIVHVEPDLSGYAQQAVLNNANCYGYCSGQANTPADLKAAVAASGVSDVAAYPNTYQGFNWALLHLRDKYAPNVLLAFHLSDWATGTDIGASTSSSLNASSLGQQLGSFAAQSGISGTPSGTSSYDLLFNDVLDRDAAYYKYVLNDPSRWWDRLNVSFPNFSRWERYLSAARQAAGRSIIVWQIPEGNQYYDSENNTNGHYQDNRAEYFFGHIGELQQVGIIGLLFGAGNAGSTVHWDGDNDGVTNPASFCTSDGLSSGQICNPHPSSYADDDGGYIRLQAAQYYASLGAPTFSLSASPSQLSFASGSSGSFSVGVAPSGGFTGTVSLSASATPSGLSIAPSSASSAAPNYPAASFTASSSTPGTYTVTVTGTSGGATHTTSLTATVTAAVAPSFTTSASVGKATVTAGTSESITAKVTSSAATTALVDVEVYSAAGTKVFQQTWDNQSFSANTAQSFSTSWAVPASQAAGTYTVEIGVFKPGWGTMYTWNGNAAQFTMQAPQPTFTTSATASPSSVSVSSHGTETIGVNVTSATALSVLVDVEVYSASGTKVFQQSWDNQSFSAGQTRSFSAVWTVPAGTATGTYTKIGIFKPGWGSTYSWNNGAATFAVTP